MKLTKQLLKEMILKQMRALNEGMLTPQNIEQDVRRVIASFQQAQGARRLLSYRW